MYPSTSFLYDQMENRITSLFISALSHLDSTIVLHNVLELTNLDDQIDLEYTNQDSERASVPDASIKGQDFLIYIESKIQKNSISTIQLENHIKQGVRYAHNFVLLCVTNDFDEPKEIQIVREFIKSMNIFSIIKWLSWKKVYEKFSLLISQPETDKVLCFVLENFNNALELSNLVGYVKITKDEVEYAQKFLVYYKSLVDKLENLGQEVVQIVSDNDLTLISRMRSSDAYERYWNLRKSNWMEITNEWDEGTAIFFGFLLDEGIFEYGVHINEKFVYDLQGNIENFLEEVDFLEYVYRIKNKSTQQRLTKYSALIDVIENTKKTKDINYIILLNSEPIIDLLDKQIIQYISEKLVTLSDALNRHLVYAK